MAEYITNPPWHQPAHALIQAWIRRRNRLRLLRRASIGAVTYPLQNHSVAPLQPLSPDIIIIDLRLSPSTETPPLLVEDSQSRTSWLESVESYYQEAQLWTYYNVFHDLTLFLAAFCAVAKALSAVTTTPVRWLAQIRYKIKALNLPKRLIPQSLRPIESVAH